MLINISFLFIAPGLLLRVLYLIVTGPATASVGGSSGISGRALANDSRSVTSLLDGRLRFLDGIVGFSIRESSAERRIERLSFFLLPKALFGVRRKVSGRVGSCVRGLDVLERDDERLLIVGAYGT